MRSVKNLPKTRKKESKRNNTSFEFSGPIRSMLLNELGAKPRRGAKKRLIELLIIEKLGPKYPKLMERFNVLREEGAI